jgi:UDP-glucose 4-epimerase
VKVLFTGASSFTGFWFVRALAAAGAEVTAALRGGPALYEGVRAERVRALGVEIVADCAFGAPRFLELAGARPFDVVCHHGAEVRDYHSPDFDALAAAAANTRNIRATLARLAERGLRAVVATGSVFEPDEGAGPEPRRAFSPYGLSKGLTWSVVRFESERAGLAAHKFVVPNPFGPYEEPRFVAHAVDRWRRGEPLEVRTPRYLRDNIHVDLLARAYARFVAEAAAGAPARKFGPCGYRETQGAFAERFARELGPRLGVEARVTLSEQADFAEPLVRVNRDAIDPAAYGFDERAAWDQLAAYYRRSG